ncbi:hypothetical protein IPdc08_01305 [archaeon]|nr:hypothetical protein IPdc08_01305 [archaeon]
MKEMFVGLDIHAEELYGAILDRHGEVLVHGGMSNRKEAIQSFFADIPDSKLIVTIVWYKSQDEALPGRC